LVRNSHAAAVLQTIENVTRIEAVGHDRNNNIVFTAKSRTISFLVLAFCLSSRVVNREIKCAYL
jgi:hypothetical protein